MLLDPVQFLGEYLTCGISIDCQLIIKDLSNSEKCALDINRCHFPNNDR